MPSGSGGGLGFHPRNPRRALQRKPSGAAGSNGFHAAHEVDAELSE